VNLTGNPPKSCSLGARPSATKQQPAKEGSTAAGLVCGLQVELALAADCGRMTGKPELILKSC